MHLRYVFAASFAVLWLVSKLWLVSVWNDLIDQVNTMALPKDRIPEGGSIANRRAIRLHRQFFPQSRLRKKLNYLYWMNGLSGLSAIACVVQFK
jgi:hypothetical protein